ncbi:hypothetical protein LINPERHAP1_LOCUS18422 [Linum perenne]
MCTSSLV